MEGVGGRRCAGMQPPGCVRPGVSEQVEVTSALSCHLPPEPHFVHALEHGDHVYFFFREVSVEDARLGRVRRWAPRVGSLGGGSAGSWPSPPQHNALDSEPPTWSSPQPSAPTSCCACPWPRLNGTLCHILSLPAPPPLCPGALTASLSPHLPQGCLSLSSSPESPFRCSSPGWPGCVSVTWAAHLGPWTATGHPS